MFISKQGIYTSLTPRLREHDRGGRRQEPEDRVKCCETLSFRHTTVLGPSVSSDKKGTHEASSFSKDL